MGQSKKGFLPEAVIQSFERLGETQLTDVLSAMSREDLTMMFIAMLKSYRLSTRVANAAWKYVELSTKEPVDQAALQTAINNFQSSLSHYSPEHFKAPQMELTHIAEVCEEIYNRASELKEPQHVLEFLFATAQEAFSKAGIT